MSGITGHPKPINNKYLHIPQRIYDNLPVLSLRLSAVDN